MHLLHNDRYNLIIECCRVDTDPQKLESLISQITDWEGFLTSAYLHGVFPLVAKSLRTLDIVPESVKEKLKQKNQLIARRNMMMSSECLRLIKRLEEDHIHALAIKGPALSQMIYGDVTTRQYADVDILVSPEKIFDACRLLISEGYHSDIDLRVLKNTIYLGIEKDFYLLRQSNNMQLEMHWELFDEKIFVAKPNDELLIDADTIELNGVIVPTLNKNITLFHLLVHGSKHVWERIEWVVDIDRLLRLNGDYDWDFMIITAKKLAYENEFYLGLKVAYEIFDTPVPDHIQIRYRDNKNVLAAYDRVMLEWEVNRLIHVEEREINRWTIFDTELSGYERIRRFVQFYTKKLTQVNPTDIKWFPLPNGLNFLYYVIHPIRQILVGWRQ